MRIKILHIVIVSIGFARCVNGQSVPDVLEDIAVLTRISGDSITLRWAPLNFDTWRLANANGYLLERFTMTRDNTLIAPEKKTFTVQPLKPEALEHWGTIVTNDKYAAIAAQALFGSEFSAAIEGSNAMSIVNHAKENDQRFQFALYCADMSPAVARKSALWFTDTTARQREKYLYRISIPADIIHRGSVVTSLDDTVRLIPPKNLEIKVNEKYVDLKWTTESRIKYAWFQVERSEDSLNFIPINDVPFTTLAPTAAAAGNLHYAVDSVDNNRSYRYRVRGVTPFGDVSPPGNTVAVKYVPKLLVNPVLTQAISLDNKSINLSWTFPESANGAVKEFVVERGDSDRKFSDLSVKKQLLPTAREFNDFAPLANNYYRVSAVAHDGQRFSSQPFFVALVDSIPPSAPVGLEAAVDEYGVLKLSWRPNLESDLFGYRVFKSNHADEESFQLTTAPIDKSTIIDNVDLKTLNKHVFYSVVAIDRNQNQSNLSQKLKVKLPDKVPPVAPVMLAATADTTGILLRWQKSPSNDVQQYEVYRSYSTNDTWTRIGTVRDGLFDLVFKHHDRFVREDFIYNYLIVAVDSTGNESKPSLPVRAKKGISAVRGQIVWENSELNLETKKVNLRWKHSFENVDRYRLYKAIDEGHFFLYRSIPKDIVQIEDRLIPGRSFQYKIVAVFKGGGISSFSKVVNIKF